MIRQLGNFLGRNIRGNFPMMSRNSADSSGSASNVFSSRRGLTVSHNPDKHSFTILLDEIGSNEPAILEYELLPGKIVDLYHTEVPVAYRGKGVAKHLAKAALDYFSSIDDLYIRLSCTYLQKYVSDHPEYKKKLENK